LRERQISTIREVVAVRIGVQIEGWIAAGKASVRTVAIACLRSILWPGLESFSFLPFPVKLVLLLFIPKDINNCELEL
jgi:hypothetical protein